MLAIVIDDGNVVDEQSRSVVGEQREGVAAKFINPELAVVVDSKPLKAIGQAWKAGAPMAGRNIE
jgi:hypothetical protein